jgi:hypothetical protein
MTSARLTAIADRKALLVTRAELDRTRMSLAVHGVKTLVFYAPASRRVSTLRPTAAMIVGLAAPLFGTKRFARWVRFGSLALTAYRLFRNWSRSPG